MKNGWKLFPIQRITIDLCSYYLTVHFSDVCIYADWRYGIGCFKQTKDVATSAMSLQCESTTRIMRDIYRPIILRHVAMQPVIPWATTFQGRQTQTTLFGANLLSLPFVVCLFLPSPPFLILPFPSTLSDHQVQPGSTVSEVPAGLISGHRQHFDIF